AWQRRNGSQKAQELVRGWGCENAQTGEPIMKKIASLLLVPALLSYSAPGWAATDFKGIVKLDVRDSKPDWASYIPKRAPAGAPNILIVLYDDTGLAAWSPYGGRIHMPTLDKLAANGLTYTQWHTTALCSPTRSAFLTGRNHHLNGMAAI